ncbi:MAG: zf-HC2 domain-containing protein [Actinobacteria bacterium]|nr:zf-HC2 domain-containing protein [Actinomycetota bacterium]
MIRFRRRRTMLTCREVGRVLQAHLDGEIEHQKAQAVATHLNGCAGCGLEADVYSEIKAALRRQAGELAPDAVERLRRFGEHLSAHGDDPLSAP